MIRNITADNISVAWARTFLEVMAPGVREIAPMVVTVTGFDNGIVREDPAIRDTLDAALLEQGTGLTCHRVARTIFPNSLWNPARPRDLLYSRYLGILPLIRRCPPNKYGVYHERMIAFGSDQVNQLEHIVQTYQGGNHRRSALQVAIFDPAKDHTNQKQRGFPCLQQVAFVPTAGAELRMSAFYPLQSLFERAYGNYLGLCWLGRFVAKELGLTLTQMSCFVGIAVRGKPNKSDLGPLASAVQGLLEARQ